MSSTDIGLDGLNIKTRDNADISKEMMNMTKASIYVCDELAQTTSFLHFIVAEYRKIKQLLFLSGEIVVLFGLVPFIGFSHKNKVNKLMEG